MTMAAEQHDDGGINYVASVISGPVPTASALTIDADVLSGQFTLALRFNFSVVEAAKRRAGQRKSWWPRQRPRWLTRQLSSLLKARMRAA